MLKALKSTPADIDQFQSVPEFGLNAARLQMFVFLPADLPDNAPLVVNLHGCRQGAREYASGVGWLDLATEYRFALLVPAQTPSNNAQNCFNWFDKSKGRDEAASIDEMIAWMLAHHSIDSARVFITGLSAGGAMASNMLALYPQRFAGGAIIAGVPYGAATNLFEAVEVMAHGKAHTASQWGDLVRQASAHRGPWPRVSVWHGTSDTRVHPLNGEAIALQWMSVHGVEESAAEIDIKGIRRRTWRAADGREVVEFYLLPGMQHGAPVDGDGDAAQFLVNAGLAAAPLIAKFWGLGSPAEELDDRGPDWLKGIVDGVLKRLGLRN